jgi:hypothetical protein
MTSTRSLVAIFRCVVLLGAPAGCEVDFEPYSRLTSLRVLAIKSEPAAPAPGEEVLLTPLVYTPMPDDAVTYAWSWCPLPGDADKGHPCLTTEADFAATVAREDGSAPSFDLGNQPTARFVHPLDGATIARLCAETERRTGLPDCEGGLPVQIKVVVETASKRIEAVRVLRLRSDAETGRNSNPAVDGMTAEMEELLPVTEDAALQIPRREDTVIRANVSEDAAERYSGTDENGNPADLRERLLLSWFVESGDVVDSKTSFIDGFTPLEDVIRTKWKPATAKEYARDTARLVVVIRDDRGGVGWCTGTVRLRARQ